MPKNKKPNPPQQPPQRPASTTERVVHALDRISFAALLLAHHTGQIARGLDAISGAFAPKKTLKTPRKGAKGPGE